MGRIKYTSKDLSEVNDIAKKNSLPNINEDLNSLYEAITSNVIESISADIHNKYNDIQYEYAMSLMNNQLIPKKQKMIKSFNKLSIENKLEKFRLANGINLNLLNLNAYEEIIKKLMTKPNFKFEEITNKELKSYFEFSYKTRKEITNELSPEISNINQLMNTKAKELDNELKNNSANKRKTKM